MTARLENGLVRLPVGSETEFFGYTIRFPQVPPPDSNTKSLSVLVRSVTGITVAPAGDVPICALISSPGCTPVVLTASVSEDGDAANKPTGGTVTFEWRPSDTAQNGNCTSTPTSGTSWQSLGTVSVSAGQATLEIQPGLGVSRARLPRVPRLVRSRDDELRAEHVEREHARELCPGTATATVVSVTAATDGKVGDQITLVASAAGSNGFNPAGGSVEFKARPSGAAIGTAGSLGSATLALDSVSNQWRATLTYTTGADNTPLADAGTYLFTAHFGQTDTLAADVSDDYSFTLTANDPTITVTLPGSGTKHTTGDSPAIVRVVLTPPAGRIGSMKLPRRQYLR